MSIYDMLAQDRWEQPLCGVTAGVVTDLNDPDQKCRVKVRLIGRTDSAQETDFIRVMTPAAGKEYGFFALPEVGDEVLVAFLDGEFAAPYVLGSLWNPKCPPPVKVEDGKNDVRLLKSKTAHRLELNDGGDAPGITLATAQGARLAMDDKAQTAELSDEGGENCLKIDIGGGTITLEAKAKLVLKCGKASIELDGSGGGITISTTGSVKLDGQQVDVSGKSAVGVKAGGQLELEANGAASLKGAVVKVN